MKHEATATPTKYVVTEQNALPCRLCALCGRLIRLKDWDNDDCLGRLTKAVVRTPEEEKAWLLKYSEDEPGGVMACSPELLAFWKEHDPLMYAYAMGDLDFSDQGHAEDT